jgi:hypothetical protein
MGQIFLAGEEAQKSPSLLRRVVADGSSQHRIASLERVEHCTLRDWAGHVEFYIAVNTRQRSEMRRKDDSDHDGVSTR